MSEHITAQNGTARAAHPVASAFRGVAAGLASVVAVLLTLDAYGRIAAALGAGVLVAILSTALARATPRERTAAVTGFVVSAGLFGALIAALAQALATVTFG